MDIFNHLDRQSSYSNNQLQLILGAWVLSGLMERKSTITVGDGHISEADYDKRSIYSLLYALYRSMGEVRDEKGRTYEATFNTWGYAWPKGKEWGECPTTEDDPQRFGRNAYTGLYRNDFVRELAAKKEGRVHIVEMGCGTGAGAHHACKNVLKECTYEAVDMQRAAIDTCRRKFVPELKGRLVATCADATNLPIRDEVADIVAVNETHVTEIGGKVTEEDKRFFHQMKRVMKPGGLFVWGNVIPDDTWEPCFDHLKSIGYEILQVRDVTEEAVQARDEDKGRIDAYADQVLQKFHGFRIPVLGSKKATLAAQAWKNFCRNPGTRLYEDMKTHRDTYKVIVARKSV